MMSFAAGDPEGFDLLYKRHSASVYRFFYFGTHADKVLAAELFHDVWMTVVRGRLRYTHDINFCDWLHHSAWARLHDHLRLHSLDRDPDNLRSVSRDSTVVTMADFLANNEPSKTAAATQSTVSIDTPVVEKTNNHPLIDHPLIEVIKIMSAEQKEVVLLRFCFSMSNQDIAEFIDVSKSTVDRIAREASILLRQKVPMAQAHGDRFNG